MNRGTALRRVAAVAGTGPQQVVEQQVTALRDPAAEIQGELDLAIARNEANLEAVSKAMERRETSKVRKLAALEKFGARSDEYRAAREDYESAEDEIALASERAGRSRALVAEKLQEVQSVREAAERARVAAQTAASIDKATAAEHEVLELGPRYIEALQNRERAFAAAAQFGTPALRALEILRDERSKIYTAAANSRELARFAHLLQ